MNGSTAFRRSPIVACIPVSTNVIVHSSMSLRRSLISVPPPESTKSFASASL